MKLEGDTLSRGTVNNKYNRFISGPGTSSRTGPSYSAGAGVARAKHGAKGPQEPAGRQGQHDGRQTQRQGQEVAAITVKEVKIQLKILLRNRNGVSLTRINLLYMRKCFFLVPFCIISIISMNIFVSQVRGKA